MTLQHDVGRRPWFEPAVSVEAQKDRPRPAGPRITRIAGELPLDEVGAPLPPRPAPPPSRLEVTQPYIPAVRDQAPEFVKRLDHGNGSAPRPTVPAGPPPPAPPPPPQRPDQTVRQAATAPQPAAAPIRPAPVRQRPAQQAPPKQRSLLRRVVRRIIGPDLLRKDPPRPSAS